jgi:cation:H+ antiporter
MENILVFLLFAVGLACIIKGGDWFVDAASWIAAVSGIPQFIIGATIVSLATTLPEILVSVMAAASGSVDMATGNAIGSVTANTGMILAISILFIPAVIERRKYLPKCLIFLGAIVLLWVLSLSGELTVIGAVVMLAVFLFFIWENVSEAKKEMGTKAESDVPRGRKTVIKNIILFVVGAVGIVIGSRLLVDNGTIIARDILGVPERIVSLTMVAIGTSLPELVTTITAIAKKQSALSVGNIVGANIIDMILILPLCSLILGGSLPVYASTLWVDLPICFAVAAITIVPALIAGRFRRWQGAAALAVYVGYVVYLCIGT